MINEKLEAMVKDIYPPDMTGTEKIETLAKVADMSSDAEPVLFLLQQLRWALQSRDDYEALFKDWEPVRDLVQEDELVTFMVGASLGDSISGKVFDFMKRCRTEWEADLRERKNHEEAEIDAFLKRKHTTN